MKVPLKWLQEYVETPSSVTELTDRLTAIGHMQDHPPVQVAGDTVLDLEVRQNRSDCLSIVGLAREVAASLQTELKLPPQLEQPIPSTSESVPVEILNPEAAYRFHAIRIDGIKVGPSPAWLKEKVEAYGMNSINNVVDITNFVMVELGEPLHAFDQRKVNQGIVVRQAREGESLAILGGRTIELTPQDIVIADQQDNLLALGGMVGGEKTGVADDTTSIILEAATYNQAYIRRSSLRHSLRTEASLRHEKFLHPELTEVALRRAVALLTELCGGQVVGEGDAYPHPVTPIEITVSVPFLQRLTGVAIEQVEAVEILTRLGIVANAATDTTIQTRIPYFRTDLVQEEDVIEEVLRIHGYDTIPDTLPATSPPEEITSTSYQLEERIRDILVDYGFDEIITEPLTRESESAREPVVLQNSLNADKTMLRTRLQPQLWAALTYQQKARKAESALFEIGQVYFQENGEYRERKMLAGVMATHDASYLRVKGVLEALFMRLQYVYPSSAVKIAKMKNKAWYFEVALEDIAAVPDPRAYSLRTSLPQVIYEDISVSVPVETKVGDILKAVQHVSPLVYKVELGETPRLLKNGEKSVFLKMQYHNPSGQITSAEVEPVRTQLVTLLTETFQAQLRSRQAQL